jgi:polyisoprenoid-binding protein YceI
MQYDPAHPEQARVSVRIDAQSIDTGDDERDRHLRSVDFLDAEREPVITFESVRVERRGDSKLAVTGGLTIRGVTREVVLNVVLRGTARDRWGNEHLGVGATTAIERGAFGLKWNETMPSGELFVGEEVEISIEIEATRLPERKG